MATVIDSLFSMFLDFCTLQTLLNTLSTLSIIHMTMNTNIRAPPSTSGTELFILHEGKKITIKDDSMKEWKEIEIEDGNIGWLPASAIERI